jgi:reverse transcriptase-like protein
LIILLAQGKHVRPDSTDATSVAYRVQRIRAIATDFEKVEWKHVHREENRDADRLACKGVHDLIEYKMGMLKAAETHHSGSFLGLAAKAFAEFTLPGDINDEDFARMQCPCRTHQGVARTASSGTR